MKHETLSCNTFTSVSGFVSYQQKMMFIEKWYLLTEKNLIGLVLINNICDLKKLLGKEER